jgi:hypothetical protein
MLACGFGSLTRPHVGSRGVDAPVEGDDMYGSALRVAPGGARTASIPEHDRYHAPQVEVTGKPGMHDRELPHRADGRYLRIVG